MTVGTAAIYTSRWHKYVVVMDIAYSRKLLSHNPALILIDRPNRQALDLKYPLRANRLLTGRKLRHNP